MVQRETETETDRFSLSQKPTVGFLKGRIRLSLDWYVLVCFGFYVNQYTCVKAKNPDTDPDRRPKLNPAGLYKDM
jgi:hypothetical protein